MHAGSPLGSQEFLWLPWFFTIFGHGRCMNCGTCMLVGVVSSWPVEGDGWWAPTFNLVFLNWRLIGIQGNLAYTLKISWMCSPSGENIPGPCCCCPFCWSINLSPTHLSQCHGSWCENLNGRGKVLEVQKSPKWFIIVLEIHKNWSTHWPSFWGDVKNFQLCKCVFSLLFWQLNKVMFNFNGNKELERP